MQTPQPDPPDLWQHLAEVVAGQLRLRRIPQRTAADATGIPISTLSNRLCGRSPFTIPELEAVSLLLGARVHEFFIAADRRLDDQRKPRAVA